MRITRPLSCTLALAAVLYAQLSFAAIISYTASLSGAAESPPNASPGTGSLLLTIDDVLNTMRVQASFSGLTGTTTAAHIHCCTASSGAGNAGVATQLPTFTGFPLGVTAGTYDRTFDLTLASSWNPAFITANGGTTAGAQAALLAGLASGRAYFNVHTSKFGGGEIRGFPQAVAEPASLLLAAAAIGALLLAQRRRSRAQRRVAA